MYSVITFSMNDYSILTSKEIAIKARSLILSDLSLYDSVAALAMKAGTNSYTLQKIFRQHFGCTVFYFSRQARINYAKQLLSGTNYTVRVIGELCGYEEHTNFIAAFRTLVGKTPGEWRKDIETVKVNL